jgi:hypothetical protein
MGEPHQISGFCGNYLLVDIQLISENSLNVTTRYKGAPRRELALR